MRLVVISPPASVPREVQLVGQLIDRGLSRYHLRKPDASRPELQRFLQGLNDQQRSKVVLHQHHELATDMGLAGVHYPERLRPPAPLAPLPTSSISAAASSSPLLLQSTSFHAMDQLDLPWGALDSAFLSPLYDSISKEAYPAAGFDLVQLRNHLLRTSVPAIIALGGITAQRVAECAALGFSGVAVIGTVWGARDPLAAFDELQAACQLAAADTAAAAAAATSSAR